MTSSPVTIRDVAQRARVGVATVSRVINNSENVKFETRQRVLDAIDELGFVPNVAARQLSSGKTHIIAVVTLYFTLPSFANRLSGVQSILQDSAYDLVLYSVSSPSHLARQLERLFSQRRVDGIILLTPPYIPDEIFQLRDGTPIVIVDPAAHFDDFPQLIVDDMRGGRIATQHLIAQGHTRIGFIGDERESKFGFTSTAKRFEGFQQAIHDADLTVNPEWHRFGDIAHATARHHARDILSLENRPTAIFATSDVKAFEVMNVAQELGLRVPDDLAVIGFDDIDAARYMRLTTVRQHLHQSGVLAAQMMLNLLAGESVTSRTALHIELIQRDTT